MPDEGDKDNYKTLRDYISKTAGRIEIFDEHNKKMMIRPFAFSNLGQMLNKIMTIYRKRILKRLPSRK
tara:strand:- start:2138 stop:2341 length:204 start_codon:yes stop_codon:yes gene_type:complete